VCYPQSRVRVTYAGHLEKHPVAHDGIFFIIYAQSLSLVRELFTVHKQRNITDVLMLKFVRVAVKRTDNIYS